MSQTLIDDQDFSRVKYNGTWIRGGSTREHDGTVASSTVVGDSFTVDFTGTSIVVYGTIDVTSEGVVTGYAVDGAPTVQITSQGGSGDTFNQQFWKSPPLSVGEHTLHVQMIKVVTSDPTPGEGTIWFDYFLVIDPTIRPNTTSNKRNIGAIAGGVVGGILALALALLFFLLIRRRIIMRRNNPDPIYWPKQDISGGANPQSAFNARHISLTHATVEPFVLSPTSEDSDSSAPSTPGNPQGVPILSSHPKASRPQPPTHSRLTGGSSTPSNEANAEQQRNPTIVARKHRQATASQRQSRHDPDPPAGAATESLEPVQHVDSGVRAIGTEVIEIPSRPVELPPVYSPV